MSDARVSARTRRQVAQRALNPCEYCRSPEAVSLQSFAVEHITPASREGPSSLNNLAYSCQGCNSHKYTKMQAVDPSTGESAPLFHPRRDRWPEHFAWSADSLILIRLPRLGRATIGGPRVDRPPVVSLRSMLRALGTHPPPE